MSKHTQGPWLYTQEGVEAFGIVAPDGHSIVHLSALHNSTAARDLSANARLIAAAPDLLEALDDLLLDMKLAQANMRMAAKSDHRWMGCAEIIQPRVDQAQAAIAKATGEKR